MRYLIGSTQGLLRLFNFEIKMWEFTVRVKTNVRYYSSLFLVLFESLKFKFLDHDKFQDQELIENNLYLSMTSCHTKGEMEHKVGIKNACSIFYSKALK